MKKLPIFATAFALMGSATMADGLLEQGLTDPEVMTPRSEWSGTYVALSHGRVNSSSETVQCFKLGDPRDCDDPVFIYYPEFKEEVRTETETSADAAGVLIGYRFDLGRVVVGGELGIYDGEVLPGVNLGVDLGRVMPYAHYDRDGAALGIDVRLSPRLTAGVRAGDGAGALTLGWSW